VFFPVRLLTGALGPCRGRLRRWALESPSVRMSGLLEALATTFLDLVYGLEHRTAIGPRSGVVSSSMGEIGSYRL